MAGVVSPKKAELPPSALSVRVRLWRKTMERTKKARNPECRRSVGRLRRWDTFDGRQRLTNKLSTLSGIRRGIDDSI